MLYYFVYLDLIQILAILNLYCVVIVNWHFVGIYELFAKPLNPHKAQLGEPSDTFLKSESS